MSEPQIYVACLASYNAGKLHGEWIPLDGSEVLEERIAEILKTSPEPDAEEWAVHDHEFCGLLGEYPGLSCLRDIVEAYAKCLAAHINWEVFLAFCEYLGEGLNDESLQNFLHSYAGSASTLSDWCEEFLDDTGQLSGMPENLRIYFNYQAYARDLEINDVFTVGHAGETLVFWHS